ncbi:hypothetical protein [Thermomonas carbonis]|uniref:WG repeat-containing protein n=1 Tax=Thermomonas carbonis TaxID=1463158 RepID=A0A7G9SPJ4_9GAMM|nr:hypothetical protein [Thermomonas carbonis]QNN69769.1 hypothetical protein H9L16_14115 [Thermomonas carbonis]GHB95386.1 hypothetical protein GCM10010080_03570 [Thermomonas carbonis]
MTTFNSRAGGLVALLLVAACVAPAIAATPAGEAEARAAWKKVNTAECVGGMTPAVSAVGGASGLLESPFKDAGLSEAFIGRDGSARRLHTTETSWYLGFEWREAFGTGPARRFLPGLFRKPDGTVWFGTLALQAGRAKGQAAALPEPNFEAPCGLRPLGRVPHMTATTEVVERGYLLPPGTLLSLGERDGMGRLQGIGVQQGPGDDYIGFFQAGKRQGWGVSRRTTNVPSMYRVRVNGTSEIPTSFLQVGEWKEGRLVRGFVAVHSPYEEIPLDIGRGSDPAFYFGDFPEERPQGKALKASGNGVLVKETAVFQGRFEGGKVAYGRMRAGASRTRVEWIWPDKYKDVPRIEKAHLDLVGGDVVLGVITRMPMAILAPHRRTLGVWTEDGPLAEDYVVLDDPKLRAEAAERIRAFLASPRYQEDVDARADIVARDEADDERIAKKLAAYTASEAQAKAYREEWERKSEEMRREWARRHPGAAYTAGPPGSTGLVPLPNTSNYETRRSDVIRRETEYKTQLINSLNKIGSRY